MRNILPQISELDSHVLKKIFLLPLLTLIITVAAQEPQVTFKIDFEQGGKAAIAKGSGEGVYRDSAGKLKLTDGFRGKGLLTGGNRQALEFPAAGNIGRQGTVTFWMKMQPGNLWKDKKDKFCMWFGWEGSGMKVFLYKYHLYERPFLLYLESPRNTPSCFFPTQAPVDETQWHFYAFTWQDKVLNLYIDGEFVGNILLKAPIPEQTAKPGVFYVGQGWGKGDPDSCVMDDLTIYDRPLTQYRIFQNYLKESDALTPQKISVGSTTRNIKIDGLRSEEAWNDAVVIPLMIDKARRSVVTTPATLSLTYDDENLYFFLRSPLDAKFFENAHTQLLHGFYLRERTDKDTDIVNDDSFEISFRRNDSGDIHFMSANTLDVLYDYFYTNAGFPIVLKWNPEWQVKSNFDHDAWELEGRIAWSGLKGKPADRAVWEMNFNRIWKKLKQEDDMWAIGAIPRPLPKGAQIPSFSAGEVTFAGADALLVKMDPIRQFSNSKVDFTLTFDNRGQAERKLSVTLASVMRSLYETTVTVPAGQEYKLNINREFSEKPLQILLRVADAKTGEVYMQQQVPVATPGSFDIDVMPFPSLHKVKLRGDFAHLHLPAGNSGIRVSLLDADGKVLEVREEKTPSSYFNLEFDFTERAAEQDYTFKVECLAGNQVVSTNSRHYRHLALPPWFHNELGISNKVPEPWTPMTFDKDQRMHCWGREYDFGDKLFFTRLTSQERDVLKSPLRLIFRSGKDVRDLNDLAAATTDLKTADAEISFTRKADFRDLKVSTTVKAEYDGFMWYEVQLSPAKKPVHIDALTLELPLSDAMTKLMIPYDYSLVDTGKIHDWRGSNRPLWAGDADIGIQFVAEHAHTWKNRDANTQLQLVRENGTWVLRAVLADKSFTLDKPLTLEFGFQVTPVKRVHPDYRKWRVSNWVHFQEKHSAEENVELLVPFVPYWGKVFDFRGEVSYPFPRESLNKKTFNRVYNGIKTSEFPYYQLHGFWYPSPEFRQFGYEWLTTDTLTPPLAPNLNDQRVMNVCQGARTLQDVILYGLDQLQKQANPRGYYFDCSQPRSCSNIEHGCGVTVDGVRLATMGIRGTRQLLKRIYTHLKEQRPDGIIMFHNSGQVTMPVHGFADLLLDGENFNGILFKNRGYEERLKPDTYLAEYVGRNLGAVVALLPEFVFPGDLRRAVAAGKKLTTEQQKYYDELTRHSNYLFGLTLLHDSAIWWSALSLESTRKHYAILKEMDYASGKHRFIPYWNNGEAVRNKLHNADYASFYLASGEVIAVLMNYGKDSDFIELELNPEKLGLTGTRFSVENLFNPERVSLDSGKLRLEAIPSYQYRAVRIKPIEK